MIVLARPRVRPPTGSEATGCSRNAPYTASSWWGSGEIRDTAKPGMSWRNAFSIRNASTPRRKARGVAIKGRTIGRSDDLDSRKLLLRERDLVERAERIAEHKLPELPLPDPLERHHVHLTGEPHPRVGHQPRKIEHRASLTPAEPLRGAVPGRYCSAMSSTAPATAPLVARAGAVGSQRDRHVKGLVPAIESLASPAIAK